MENHNSNTALAVFFIAIAVILIGGLIVIGDGNHHYFSAVAQLQQSPQFQPPPQQQQPQQPFPPPPQQQPFAPSPSPTPSPSQPGGLGPTQPQQQAPIDPQSVQYVTYEDSEGKIRIDYPSHWQQLTPQPPDVAAFLNPQTYAFVGVSAVTVPQGTTLEEVNSNRINALSSSVPGFQLMGQGPVRVDDKDGYSIVYSSSDPQGNSFISNNAWTISNDVVYELRYVAPSSQFPLEILIADYMTATFNILDSWFE